VRRSRADMGPPIVAEEKMLFLGSLVAIGQKSKKLELSMRKNF
jgi:hypothetical protein